MQTEVEKAHPRDDCENAPLLYQRLGDRRLRRRHVTRYSSNAYDNDQMISFDLRGCAN